MRTLPPPRAVRGQAAAMMAVTMALIGLMVCLTIGIGMKVKEKAEVQTLADVSAYSGAVATARTFNSIAILNRVEISEMVSAVATQSLVSYAGYYRAMVWSAREQFQAAKNAIGACPDTCGFCGRYDALITNAGNEATRITQNWNQYDGDGNTRIDDVRGRAANSSNNGVYGAALSLYTSLYNDQIVGTSTSPPLADAIVQRVDNASSWAGEMTAPNTVGVVNQRELGVATNCLPGEYLICEGNAPAELTIKATMGARWYPFERDATNLSQMLQDALMTNLGLAPANGENANVANYQGSTRFVDRPFEHALPGGMGLLSEGMEGQLELDVYSATCGTTQHLARKQVQSWVYSTSILNGNDVHYYSYVLASGAPFVYQENQGTHALPNATCNPPVTPCGMWPGFLDMNPAQVSPTTKFRDLYGQPKIVSVVQRNYRARGSKADPWNLLKNVTIRRSQAAEEIDTNGFQTSAPLDISMQTAIATGLAYYHRKDHWREPPNFFNPYWHATLVSGAIDEAGNPITGGTDLRDVSANAPFAQTVIEQLARQGFHGWQ